MISAASVRPRLTQIETAIEREARSQKNVTLVAVTKGFDISAVDAAAHLGIMDIGENYAQECITKLSLRDDRVLPQRLHFIGQLQRRKVAMLAPLVSMWQSVDREALVDEIAKHAPGATIFVQRNMSDDPKRGGSSEEDVSRIVAYAKASGLVVDGLMCVAVPGDQDSIRAQFRALRHQVDELGLHHCSMGMSNDYVVALQEGSTVLRIGTALFGHRG